MLPEIVDAIRNFVEQLSELDHESGTMPNAPGQLVEMQPSQVVHDSIIASRTAGRVETSCHRRRVESVRSLAGVSFESRDAPSIAEKAPSAPQGRRRRVDPSEDTPKTLRRF